MVARHAARFSVPDGAQDAFLRIKVSGICGVGKTSLCSMLTTNIFEAASRAPSITSQSYDVQVPTGPSSAAVCQLIDCEGWMLIGESVEASELRRPKLLWRPEEDARLEQLAMSAWESEDAPEKPADFWRFVATQFDSRLSSTACESRFYACQRDKTIQYKGEIIVTSMQSRSLIDETTSILVERLLALQDAQEDKNHAGNFKQADLAVCVVVNKCDLVNTRSIDEEMLASIDRLRTEISRFKLPMMCICSVKKNYAWFIDLKQAFRPDYKTHNVGEGNLTTVCAHLISKLPHDDIPISNSYERVPSPRGSRPAGAAGWFAPGENSDADARRRTTIAGKPKGPSSEKLAEMFGDAVRDREQQAAEAKVGERGEGGAKGGRRVGDAAAVNPCADALGACVVS